MGKTETIQEAFFRASSILEANHVNDATFRTEVFLRDILQLTRAQFFSRLEEAFTPEDQEKLGVFLERSIQGEPLQYILGGTEFYGRFFYVDSNVLIPRPETELLLEEVLRVGELLPQPVHVVEIGTGSGIIAITLSLQKPDWKITAIDISKDALSVAKRNAALYKREEEITWLHGAYLAPLPTGAKMDILVSNPPYIPSSEIVELDKEVKDFEPKIALDGGVEGLDAYCEIMAQVALHKPKALCFEIGWNQADCVKSLIMQHFRDADVTIHKDLRGHDRIVIGKI